jgi:hypothetical protein
MDLPMLKSTLKISLLSIAVGIPVSALAFVALALANTLEGNIKQLNRHI